MTPWNSVTNWSVTTYHDARSHCHGLLYANDYLTEIIIMTHFFDKFWVLVTLYKWCSTKGSNGMNANPVSHNAS